jgi:hypothetical protein
MFLHLAEMRPAGDSGKVAEEDKQHWPGVQVTKANGRSI